MFATDSAGNADTSPAARTWAVDATAPGPSLAIPKQKLGKVLKGGLKGRVGSTEHVTFTLICRVGATLFGKRSGQLDGGQKSFTMRATKAAKKKLRKKRSALLSCKLTETDTAGNAARPVTRRVKLKK